MMERSLHSATANDHKEIAELLIAEGADVNAKVNDGRTPLDFATDEKQTEIADLLRQHGGKHGSILVAASGGDIEAVKEFLATGTDVNAKDDLSWTPLHFAARDGHKEIAELLIAKGADVNTKNSLGRTPLDQAKGETADLLRKHEAKTGYELQAEGN